MLNRFRSVLTVTALISFSSYGLLRAQPTFKELPGYEKHREISALRTELAGGGKVEQIRWSDDGSSVQYTVAGKRKSIDLKSFVHSDDSTPVTPDAEMGNQPWAERNNGPLQPRLMANGKRSTVTSLSRLRQPRPTRKKFVLRRMGSIDCDSGPDVGCTEKNSSKAMPCGGHPIARNLHTMKSTSEKWWTIT